MNLALSAIEQGLIYAVLAIGVYISYKILKISDLTVESSFPFGALLYARFAYMGTDPVIGTILVLVVGSLTGLLTALLHIGLKIEALLAGILSMTMLYSINLKINGDPNASLVGERTIFETSFTENELLNRIIILIAVVLIIKLLVDVFMKTEVGYLLVTTGDNKSLVKSLGQNSNLYVVLGLMLANGLVALSGALLAQANEFGDVTMGQSIIVDALASIIIGDTLLRRVNLKGTTRAIMGAIIYRGISALAIDLGFLPQDLKLVKGAIVVLFIAYNNGYAFVQTKRKMRGLEHARD